MDDNPVSSIQSPTHPVTHSPTHPLSSIQHPVSRIRLQFAKREEVKFISHLDLLNTFTRAFRRAEIPIAYSHGFNPHPKISFGSVLPVGTTSEAEFADVDLESPLYAGIDDFIVRANDQLPPGLELLKAQEIPLKSEPLMAQISLASYIVALDTRYLILDAGIQNPESRIQNLVSRILNMDHIWIERPRKSKKRTSRRAKHQHTLQETSNFVDIKPLVKSIKFRGSRPLKPPRVPEGDNPLVLELEMELGDGKAGKVRPEEVIHLIFSMLDAGGTGIPTCALASSIQHSVSSIQYPASSIEIQKTGSFVEHQGQFFSPMEIINQ